MAATNFGRLQSEQLLAWSKDIWSHARRMAFVSKFIGDNDNSVIQRVSELTKDKKGARAIMTLVADLEGDGVAGDRQLEGNEEAMKSYDQIIRIDQLRHANTHEGRMADQKSVIRFREQSRDKLAYWLSDRIDQMAFLTLSGVQFTQKYDGSTRVGSALPQLEFAADVKAPTAKRRLRWDSASSAVVDTAATSAITANDKLSYKALVKARAYMKDQMIRGVRGDGGKELFHVFVTPQCMANLKLDADYLANVRAVATSAGRDSTLLKGGLEMVDGFVIHEHAYVYNTAGLASSSKWGSGGLIEGCQVLICGAQAMGMADIGEPEWVEKEFDYDNRPGISIAKMFGMLKPQFTSLYAGNTVQDYGVVSLYVAQ